MSRDPLQQQRGMVLIVCLIVLVVVTIMGLSSIRDTSMEEKMAGNMKNRNMAFQAAESALREGEAFVETTSVLPSFDGSDGLYPQLSDVLHGVSWSVSSAVRSYGSTLSGLAEDPVYIIEQMESELESESLEASQSADTQTYYRITARAVGSTATAVVILQTIYRR